MPTTLPRRRTLRTNRGLEAALALAILMEGVMLATGAPRSMARIAKLEPPTLQEQPAEALLDAMLGP